MEATVTRIEDLEVASFLDRIALFCTAGCNPQQAIEGCLSSMQDAETLRQETLAVIHREKGWQSPADLLLEVSKRVDSEALLFTSMAFVMHVRVGAEIGGPLTRLAEVLRWGHRARAREGSASERELAVALFAHKLDFLVEINESPQAALGLLCAHDPLLGPELLRIRHELLAGYPLPEAFARSAERTGSRGMKLLAVGLQVSLARGVSLAVMLRRTAETIRRELEA